MEVSKSFNEINENNEDWGYFLDLENLKTTLPKNKEIIYKKNILKFTKFQYSDISYKEYCDEFNFNINDNLKKNINNYNSIYNNKSNKSSINIYYITTGIISLSLTILLFNYKKYLN